MILIYVQMSSKDRRSVTLPHSMEAASLTNADDVPALSTDDYVHVQVSGSHRVLPPVIVMPTHLCQRIKATRRDTGLVRDASFQQSQLFTPVTLPQTSAENNIDDNPFLSELILQLLKVPSNAGAQSPTTIQPPSRSMNISVCNQCM